MDKVVHFELPVEDMERAKKFYGSIFGWDIKDWHMPDGTTHVGIRTVEIDEKTSQPKEAGAINGMFVPKSKQFQSPVVTMKIPSIDDYLHKIESAGGKVVSEKFVVEGMGAYIYLQDTEGNMVGLWEDAKQS